MLKKLISSEPDEWIEVLNSEQYLMRSKKQKNLIINKSVKRVKNINQLVYQIKNQQDRPQSGKYKGIETTLYEFKEYKFF